MCIDSRCVCESRCGCESRCARETRVAQLHPNLKHYHHITVYCRHGRLNTQMTVDPMKMYKNKKGTEERLGSLEHKRHTWSPDVM